MRMKRGDLKRLLKPIIRECLQDIISEQLDPAAMHEALGASMVHPQRRSQQAPAVSLGDQLINPLDDHQMKMRQEIASQRGLLAQQMRRQSAAFNQDPMGQAVYGLDQLAGVADDPDSSARRYSVSEGTGYVNPSDRVRMNSMALVQQPYGNHGGRYDPRLDTPMGGPPQAQHHMQHQRPFMLDPGLDTPIGGGDIRPPDPDILRSIYDDTMRTTYVQQARSGHVMPSHMGGGGQGAEHSPPADRYAAVVADHRPEELFEGSQNWAMLALS